MNIGTFLQAVISIVFIYLILSLLTSELQEYLSTIFEARAKRLKQSIRQMLGEQDYPYYRLEFNGSEELEKDNWIWLQDGKINKIIGNGINNADSIFIKESDNSIIQKTDAIEDLKNTGKFYLKGEAVSNLPVYEGADKNKYWARNVNLIDDQTKLTSDRQFIWIKDSDNNIAVNEGDVELDSTSPDNDKGIMKSDNSSHLTKYPVYSEVDNSANKVWIKPEDIKQIDSSANPASNFVFVKDDNSVVNETDVITIPGSQNQDTDTYYIKGESVKKLPVASIAKILQEPVVKLNESPIYLWDNDKFTILDGNNIMIKLATFSSKPESKPFSFLTDKLYEHPNIQALNQSSFGWLSLFSAIIMKLNGSKNGKLAFIFGSLVWILFFLVSIFFLGLSFFLNLPLLVVVVSIVVLLLTIGWFVRFNLKHGKGRKSIGPSYIEDSGLFAQTLISVIKENSDNPTPTTSPETTASETTASEKISTRLDALQFYTPAIPTLKRIIKNSGDTETTDFKNFLEEQYKNIQKRSSGSYKRNSKGLSFVVGLVIAILLNADTFNMISNVTKENNNFSQGNRILIKCSNHG